MPEEWVCENCGAMTGDDPQGMACDCGGAFISLGEDYGTDLYDSDEDQYDDEDLKIPIDDFDDEIFEDSEEDDLDI